MKPRSILLLVIPLLVSSCGNNSESSSFSSESLSSSTSISESNSTSSEIVSSSTSISESSSTSSVESSISSSEESESSAFTYSGRSDPVPSKAVYTTNPMNEPLIHNQYYLNHIGDIYNTWKYYRGKGVTIAVIDIGFKYNHEDFTYSNGKSKVSSLSAAFTSNINKSTGEYETKIVTGASKTAPDDANESHGTFCAGVAAAGLNGKGIVGIAPEAELMLLKTDAKPRSIDAAFRYAADKGAKVVTISIGSYKEYGIPGDLVNDGTNLEEAFVDAVKHCREKGTVVISAAGNGGGSKRATDFTYPGGTIGVIGAGGLQANSSTKIWEGSSYNKSSTKVLCDVYAPSDDMFGCCNYDGKKYDGGWNGTSFSSPIVAGIAALYFEKYPDATVDEFEYDLYHSCQELDSSISKVKQANGRVDVGNLLGSTNKEKISIKVKNTGDLYAFVWNSVSGDTLKKWPGVKLSQSGSYYTYNFDSTKYDSIIFTDGDVQTIDISASSFIYKNVYNLDVEYSGGLFIGQYISN